MADDYEQWEKDCEQERKKNNEYLKIFKKYLKEQQLSDKTINKHLSNVDFFLNDYLLSEDVYSMESGLHRLDDFLGYFYIRKCSWSTPASIKTTAASIKKFYKCMLEHEKIKPEDYVYLSFQIRSNMDEWVSTCAQYNDLDQPNPFDIW